MGDTILFLLFLGLIIAMILERILQEPIDSLEVIQFHSLARFWVERLRKVRR